MKEKILAHSLEIFNAEGPQEASLRHLARQMKISDGHLRYYFKTKNRLILALLEEFSAAAEELESVLLETGGESFPNFLLALGQQYKLRSKYRFLLLDSHHLGAAIPEYGSRMDELLAERRSFLGELISRLQVAGVINHQLPQWRFDMTLDQFHALSFEFLRKMIPGTRQEDLISQGVQLSAGLLLPLIPEKDRKMATVQLLAV